MNKNFNKVRREILRIYKSVDWQLVNENKACTAGCSHCCHQNIPVHAAEELTITEYVSSKFSTVQKSELTLRLRDWLRFLNDHTPEKFALSEQDVQLFGKEFMKHKVPCPFLLDHKCSIYPVRPMTCRTFYVATSPEKCEADPGRNGEANGYKIQLFGIKEISRAADQAQLRLLPYAVADHLGVRDAIKKGIATEIVMSLVERK